LNQRLGTSLRKQKILVTGGAGSLGSSIVKEAIKFDPDIIRILDNNETGLFELERNLGDRGNLRFLVGDVRDKSRMIRAMENIDVVFHTAALKHVPLCEYNPFEAVQTNVLGTQNVIDAALACDVGKIVNLSSDKATNPANVMGATKLLTERLMTCANFYRGYKRTIFFSVRFGNVLASRGSVVDLFLKQISKGQTIETTDPSMTRFVMRTSDAVDLVFKSLELAHGGEIFILKMPALRLKDLAEVLLEEAAPCYGYKPQDIPVSEIGMRPGEKLHEELMTESEAAQALETEDMFIVPPQIELRHRQYPGAHKVAQPRSYTSDRTTIIKKEDVTNVVRSLIEEMIIGVRQQAKEGKARE